MKPAPIRNSDRRSEADAPASRRRTQDYLFSPLVDWLFVANVLWPLIVLVDWAGGLEVHEGILFWQIFFVTAPHRWITLVLVSTDHQRNDDRRWKYVSFGAAILFVCIGLRTGTGSLLCLGLVDYFWNAWHFASQHHGIYRIYQRDGRNQSLGLQPTFQKIIFRGFLLYVIARVAGFGWSDQVRVISPTFGSITGVTGTIAWIDAFAFLIPPALVCGELGRWRLTKTANVASIVYLTSVMCLFTAMLLATHLQKSQLVIQLAVASAIFHSMEYMSIVTWSVRKHDATTESPLGRLSKTWFLFLLAFVSVIGIGNYLLSRGQFELWVTINLVVAFWHYCFDGMIWKRRPKSAVSSAVPGVR